MTNTQIQNFETQNKIKTNAIDDRLEFIQKYLKDMGIESAKSTCYDKLNTQFGNSGYVGHQFGASLKFKIRVSDHSTGSRRMMQEIMFSYEDTMESIFERLERSFNTSRWSDKVVVREEINTEKGIKGIFKNAAIILLEAAVKVSKKGNVMNHYQVTMTKKVFA